MSPMAQSFLMFVFWIGLIHKTLMDELEIGCWEMVAGGSLGGMQAPSVGSILPRKIKRAAIIAPLHKLLSKYCAQ